MTKHIPVLKRELVECLNLKKDDVVFDCTLGGGGHALEVITKLEKIGGGKFIGIDLDQQSINNFETTSKKFDKVKIELINENFTNIEEICNRLEIGRIDKIYADLGFSSDQIEEITFRKDRELDLRIDKNLMVKAKDLLNGLYKREIEKMFRDYSDVKYAGVLAREIEFYKKTKPLERTTQLNAIVKTVLNNFNKKFVVDKELQKIYQALRIAVNNEFLNLEKMLTGSLAKLNNNGRIAVISFHSGEDRITKKIFKSAINTKKYKWVKELVISSDDEISTNIRSRSAKMRVIEKI